MLLRRLLSLFTIFSVLLFSGVHANSFLTGGDPDFSIFSAVHEDKEGAQEEVLPAAMTEDPVKAELLSEEKDIQPGQAFWVALKINLEKDWHTYWKNPGEIGLATSIDWHLPLGFEVLEVEWPTPQRFVEKTAVAFGYDDSFVVLAKVLPSQGTAIGQPVQLGATIRWVACNLGNCIPGDTPVQSSPLSVINSTPAKDANNASVFAHARKNLPTADWRISANNGTRQIQLTIDKPEGLEGNYAAAYFVPLEADVFNARQHLSLTPSSNGRAYTVNLNKLVGKNLKGTLEGVLLLQPSAGSHAEPLALAIKADLKEGLIAEASNDATQQPQNLEENYVEFEGGIGLAIIMAFAGGMILNLMPCVLPVISLKVLSIIKMAGKSRASTFKHGLMFSAGVVASFWVLAGALLMLQAYGRAVGWGFQLQEPIFVAILAAVLLILAMSLFGVFEMGTTMAAWAGQAESQNTKKSNAGYYSSFFNGVLATAVATPCTGPFLGSAVGFAVTLPPIAALTIFTALGLGMAFPYLLLTAFPVLVKWLPKPGNWMVTFKQFMGFLLMATILWLVWVFGAQTNYVGIFLLLCSLFFLTLGCWVYGRCCTSLSTRKVRRAGAFLTIALALVGGYFLTISANIVPEDNEKALANALITGQEDPKAWLQFTSDAVEKFRAEGKPVFIDFTAKWCVICQTNHFVLSMDDIEQKFADLGIMKFKADWTRPDPEITKELRKYGRNGVPLYLLYVPGVASPLILPQVLTPDVISKYLEQMRSAIPPDNNNANSVVKP
jgi:thiol:disulfide interchange protein/DsbC/DsbD-like thiol-disulfide interchange protein